MKSVVTTIHPLSDQLKKLSEVSNVVVIGDHKTPFIESEGINFVSIHEQKSLDFEIVKHLPENHYSRKNIGYLLAMDSPLIYDTDDDNCPNDNWKQRGETVEADSVSCPGWCNVYSYFTGLSVWPRGLSLNHIRYDYPTAGMRTVTSPIQQGLADIEPDVDAIWRLTLKGNVYFNVRRSVTLEKDVWCPFNSQSTWWFPFAYPLLYLPIHCSFRMTDIWRSFIAQRILWEYGMNITFHSPSEVYQQRNEHDLLKDFEQEIPGYLNNDRIVKTLSELQLMKGEGTMYANLMMCYEALHQENIFPLSEVESVAAWITDCKKVLG